jgi:hypothetical protein
VHTLLIPRLYSHFTLSPQYRFHLWNDYLKTTEVDFDRILMTDVRDVFFQRNPFAIPGSTGEIIAQFEFANWSDLLGQA